MGIFLALWLGLAIAWAVRGHDRAGAPVAGRARLAAGCIASWAAWLLAASAI